MNIEINGKTCITGLIGNPVEHSISPQLHNTLCGKLKIDSAYLPFRVLPGDLEKVISAFKSLNVQGFNVTIPYKTEIMKYLDEVSQEALLIGAVNTVKNVNGRLVGHNTDGQGFIKSLQSQGFDVNGKNVVILGAGGAARAVSVKLAQNGANRIVILNRSMEKAEMLSDLVNQKVRNIALGIRLTQEHLSKYATDCHIVVNTTPVGMWPNTDSCPVDSEIIFEAKPLVFDLIYNPLKTKFLSKAEENHCKIVNGLGMLVYQGISASEIWNDISVPLNFGEEMIRKFEEYFN